VYDNGIYEETGELYKFPICHDKGRFHPTQKPLDLISELIKKHSNEGDLVLDCFSGSGTTAAACIQTNRNFIGCEISEEYYKKSVERLNQNNITIQNDYN
jgi:DNA modification methylase